MQNKKLYCVIDFSRSLPLHYECVGEAFPFSLIGFNGKFYTPMHSDKFVKGIEDGIFSKLNQPHIDTTIKNINWGSYQNLPDGHIHAGAFAIQLTIETLDEDTPRLLFRRLLQWRQLFLENITFISQLSLRKPIKSGAIVDGSVEVSLFNYDRTIALTKRPDVVIESPIYENVIKKDQLFLALQNASLFMKPAFEFNILMDAKEALDKSDYRRSILDASTALEISFQNAIEPYLNVDDEKIQGILNKLINSMEKKRQMLKLFEIEHPKLDYNFLDNKRAEVVHKGHIASLAEATKVYSIAHEAMDKISVSKYEIVDSSEEELDRLFPWTVKPRTSTT